jgi:hypothetical protein
MAEPPDRDNANAPEGPDGGPEGPNEPPEPFPPGTGLWLGLALLVYVGIVGVQLFPFDFDTPRGPLLGLTYPGPWRLLLQVVIFVPLGVIDGELARRMLRGWGLGSGAAALVAIDAAILALVCETVQYWVASRPSSLVDVIAAALGGVAGYMLYSAWRGHPK